MIDVVGRSAMERVSRHRAGGTGMAPRRCAAERDESRQMAAGPAPRSRLALLSAELAVFADRLASLLLATRGDGPPGPDAGKPAGLPLLPAALRRVHHLHRPRADHVRG